MPVSCVVPDQQSVTATVCLLGGPYILQDGHKLAIPEGCKRLLAFVALNKGRVDRRRAAGSLWPEGLEERACGNLRSVLWRLRGAGIEVLESDKTSVYLRERTQVDLDYLCDWADRVVAGSATPEDLRVPEWTQSVTELLPGWYDDWVIYERERVRQRMLHALEVLSCRLLAAGRYGEAIDAAMDAVAAEPLRESAQRVLVEAHIAEGNYVEARRTFGTYRDLVRRELGIEPSTWFSTRVRGEAGTRKFG